MVKNDHGTCGIKNLAVKHAGFLCPVRENVRVNSVSVSVVGTVSPVGTTVQSTKLHGPAACGESVNMAGANVDDRLQQ